MIPLPGLNHTINREFLLKMVIALVLVNSLLYVGLVPFVAGLDEAPYYSKTVQAFAYQSDFKTKSSEIIKGGLPAGEKISALVHESKVLMNKLYAPAYTYPAALLFKIGEPFGNRFQLLLARLFSLSIFIAACYYCYKISVLVFGPESLLSLLPPAIMGLIPANVFDMVSMNKDSLLVFSVMLTIYAGFRLFTGPFNLKNTGRLGAGIVLGLFLRSRYLVVGPVLAAVLLIKIKEFQSILKKRRSPEWQRILIWALVFLMLAASAAVLLKRFRVDTLEGQLVVDGRSLGFVLYEFGTITREMLAALSIDFWMGGFYGFAPSFLGLVYTFVLKAMLGLSLFGFIWYSWERLEKAIKERSLKKAFTAPLDLYLVSLALVFLVTFSITLSHAVLRLLEGRYFNTGIGALLVLIVFGMRRLLPEIRERVFVLGFYIFFLSLNTFCLHDRYEKIASDVITNATSLKLFLLNSFPTQMHGSLIALFFLAYCGIAGYLFYLLYAGKTALIPGSEVEADF